MPVLAPAKPPWWALVAAVAAPVLLIGGWSLAQTRQPSAYSPVRDTISALAGRAAPDRWVMTVALAGLGLCYLVTALGLRAVATPGRVTLAIGGIATVLVAAFPLGADGRSTPHGIVAGLAFAALAIWPALAGPPRALGLLAAGVLVGLVAWFVIELAAGSPTAGSPPAGPAAAGSHVGLAERVAAAAQAAWPLMVALALRLRLPVANRMQSK